MAFKKGAKPGPGRPLGMKNKNFTNLSIWFEMLHNEVESLEQKDRLNYIVLAIDKLLPKVPMLPATPGDSVGNAVAAQAIINQALEDQKQKMVDQLNADTTAAADSD